MPPKRKHDENEADASTAESNTSKKKRAPRLKAVFLTDEEVLVRQAQLVAERAEQRRADEERAEAARREASTARLRAVLEKSREEGFETVHEFLVELLSTRDQLLSSQVTRMLANHLHELFDLMSTRQPSHAQEWAGKHLSEIVNAEGAALEELLKPAGDDIADRLEGWSFGDIMTRAEAAAPVTCALLAACTMKRNQSTRRDRELVFVTILCMLAHARNERSNDFQSMVAFWMLACGASKTQFDVLSHAGISSSYSKAIGDLKKLSDSQMKKIREIIRTRPCMLVWDNINIAFRVGEQRLDSKDHFDNGTTFTLIPLFDVKFGDLPLDLLPPRMTRSPDLKFQLNDLLPTPECIAQLEAEHLWHIEDFLFAAYPGLRQRLDQDIMHAPPVVLQIPVHKTEHYPLPAVHADESTIDGTIEVIETARDKSLHMTEADIISHGYMFCVGDQLTNSLHDKACTARRDDTNLLDNFAMYTVGAKGLWHAKQAGGRVVENEHWGTPNSSAAFSLWRINSLLGRKSVSVGWKVKKSPPLQMMLELMLDLTLPANILDGFRVYCPGGSLDTWVARVKSIEEIHAVSKQILDQLCSARRVTALRKLADRDIILENIILFNRDSLLLLALQHSIKRGDIGAVVNALHCWMLMFRGTGHTPRYADSMFEILVQLKTWPEPLRHAYLMNWLVNLTGKENSFKEVDLLQEHQNYWAKIIYAARGSNKSWEWLSMVTVCIYALRDAIRVVQKGFKTPYNGKSHTSPNASRDIGVICEHLKSHVVQTYTPDRAGNRAATPVRDLIALGAAYANTASAYKAFRTDDRKIINHGFTKPPKRTQPPDELPEDDQDGSASPEPSYFQGIITFDDLLAEDDGDLDMGMMQAFQSVMADRVDS